MFQRKCRCDIRFAGEV